ncbi:MAG: aminotransferase class I/II-fold pyridoxal phosphate-dependent enzyme [Leptonema sp. (in: Bacteria)]|nr:aminotransferase class I/II-fold pyridoxal phosphate-dependent enzyme [Leptonema sp. (in: bacteria)]
MQFSQFAKVAWSEPGIFKLMEDLDSALSTSQKIYFLGGGNPAFVEPVNEYYRQQFLKIGTDTKRFSSVVGIYDGPSGNTSFREAVSYRLNQLYGWPITVENVLLTQGSQNGFFLLLNLFSGKFENGQVKKILFVQSPEYIGYEHASLNADSMIAVPSIRESLDGPFFRYTIDTKRIETELKTGSIGAMCVSRPSNPTGGMLTDDEMKTLSKLAGKYQLPLIIDGAYGDPWPGVVYNNESTAFYDQNTILVLSLSKTGLPGIRTGIIIASNKVCRVLERIQAIQHLAPGSMGPALTQEGIRDGSLIQLCKDDLPAFYLKRQQAALKIICSELQPKDEVLIHRPDGAFFLWAVFPKLKISAYQFYNKLKEANVIVVPGNYYYPGLSDTDKNNIDYDGERALRISYVQDEHSIEEGLRILCRIAKQNM